MAVDVTVDVVQIPRGTCPPYDGMFAMTRGAVVQLKQNEIARAANCKTQILAAQTETLVSQTLLKDAQAALAKALWWQRYGPALIGVTAAVLGAAGAVVGFELGHAPR